MRIRIKFAKKDSVKYLGHLDIMRFFQRCFNRAEVKMEYSAGYNPHQKMSFAQPLGVGIISRGEYLDAEIADGQDLNEICRRLNGVCGDGFEVINVKAVEEGAKKAMAALQFASYEVDVRRLVPETEASNSSKSAYELLSETEELEPGSFNSFDKEISRAINDLFLEEHIYVSKTTKSGTREVDIRPQIIQLTYQEGIVYMMVTAGSDNNLKPDTLLTSLFAKTNIEYQKELITITREELYAEGFVPLDQFQCE